ncbi:MAG: type I-E CRISPR-associated protein Cse2/CasB, partial [bacterium]
MSGQNSMAWRVERLTEKRLTWLINQASEGVCKATLAELRRGVGREPGEIPALWGMLLEDMPEDMQGRGTRASRQEMAIYMVLTLFAVHQQGWEPRKSAMYQPEMYLGKAVARLVAPGDEDSRERVERRFTRAATAA